MKRLTFTLLTLCLALAASAEPIGNRAARYTAQSYMLAKGKQLSASQPSLRKASGYTTTGDANEQPYYYVFNAGDDGGYVIVSGDDRVEPILGYVDQGSFDPDNIPENMRSWLQTYADEIKYIVVNDIQPDSPLLKKRNRIQGTRHSVGEILTTRWNQGSPYNITCPKYYKKEDGTRHYPATGCTATAMAQVLYFYKYPEKTKAVIPSHSNTYTYTTDGGKTTKTATVTTPAIPRNTVIDWDNMRDTYNWIDIDHANAQDTAVANLMLYCGQAVKMGWGPSSGANFSAEAYINYFGYDSRAYVGERSNYSIDDWFDLLYNEIDLGFPVLFSGFSSGGGHAFVLDGFDGENLFHLNWGWGGGSNGWFLVGILNPGDNSGIGASSSSDGYSMSQRALFNLRLPRAPKEEGYLSISDVSVTNTSIKAKYTNRTGSTNTFHAGIVMLDENEELVLVGTKQNITGLANNSSKSLTFPMTGKLTEGTYRLSPASKPSKSEEWQAEFDFENQYIEAVVDSEGDVALSLKKPIPTTESISIDTIVFPGNRVQKEQQEIKVTFRNNGKEYFRTIYLLASKTQQKVYTESKSIVACRAGETVDVSYFFTPDTTGTYNLWFSTDDKGNNVIGTGTIDIITEAQAVKASLTVSEYKITNLVSGSAYGKCLVGTAKIKNNRGTPFNGAIRLTIWNQPNGSGSAWGGTSKTYEVSIGGSRTITVDFSFDGLEENNKYYISASYVGQKGDLGNGGVWDLGGWMMKPGLALWKNDGTITGKAHANAITVSKTICGVLADCSKAITRMSPNDNPNTIYAFSTNLEIPSTLDSCNTVLGKHADRINLVSGEPYYVPATFRADSASFTYTFPETENGTGWHAITMPFDATTILVDSVPVELNDTLNHFWIYEFRAQKSNGDIVFAPATKLRSGIPYIIAGDQTMAGRSVVFEALNVPFYKAGTDKMAVTTSDFKFHGNTYAPKVRDSYVLNEEGTAFEYSSTLKTLEPMASYFTTSLPDSVAPTSIILPDVPVAPVKETIFDEMATNDIVAGTFSQLTLKRTFDVGLNTICLPFQVDDVTGIFGQDAQAYEFYSFANNELNFVKADKLTAGQPYILFVPDAITEDIVLSNVRIDETSTQPGFITKSGASFRGTYKLSNSDVFSMELHRLETDGTLVKYGPDELIYGFRAVFYIPTDEEVTICFYDDPTGIASHFSETETGTIYNLAGQRLSKKQKGIYIMNGKKILK